MKQSTQPSRRPARILAALVISVGLAAAACGGDDDEGTKDTTEDTPATTSGGGDGTAAPTTVAEVEPVPGGKVVFGVEADTSSPWRPAEMLCAISCQQVIRNIYDTLTMPTSEGNWAPYLAESLEPNDDYTEWRITARSGVKFHDGTDFDGAAIVENLNRAKRGTVTGAVLAAVESVEIDPADPMVAVVKVASPWVAFPYHLSGQSGFIASPTWLLASDDDETLRSKPVGTGPFVYDDYRVNEVFLMKRNPDYWNQPYPYLDSVEFRPISDGLSRRDALLSGSIDMLHTANGQNISSAREDDDHNLLELTAFGETGYTLLHVTQEGSPLNDQRIRCALAYATDEGALIEAIGMGVQQQANGPFSPTQVGYLEDTGYPMEQDMAEAQRLIAEYKAEHPGTLKISMATTQDQTNAVTTQQQQQWWLEAGFDEVTIDQIDQAAYIATAAFGNFQVFQWRNHGGFDLDEQYRWWHSSGAKPVGQLTLNFGRIDDAELDALLDENRASTDPVRKKEIAEEVNRLFGEQCYNLWSDYTVWGIMSDKDVHGPVPFELPDGDEVAFGAGFHGNVYMMNVWVDQ